MCLFEKWVQKLHTRRTNENLTTPSPSAAKETQNGKNNPLPSREFALSGNGNCRSVGMGQH